MQALEDTLNAAWLRHDTLSLGRLIGADFRGIPASGRSLARADMLRAAAQTEESATDYTDRTARAFGDVVVIAIPYGAVEQILNDPDIPNDHVRAFAGPNNNEGVGVSEAPRGILTD